MQDLINCGVIAAGAIVIVIALVQSRDFVGKADAIRPASRRRIRLFFTLYQALMVFFLLGYLGAIVAIYLAYPLLSESFVSFIFLFGSIFVLLSVRGQRGLLRELAAADDPKE